MTYTRITKIIALTLIALVACSGVADAKHKKRHKKKAKPAPPAAPATPVTEKTAEYNQRIEFTVHKQAANPVCQITLVLLAEHDTDTAGAGVALLTVDTLDLSIKTAGQAQYKR